MKTSMFSNATQKNHITVCILKPTLRNHDGYHPQHWTGRLTKLHSGHLEKRNSSNVYKEYTYIYICVCEQK